MRHGHRVRYLPEGSVARRVFRLFVVAFDADLAQTLVDGDVSSVEMFVESGVGAGKALALETEFDSVLLATGADIAGLEQFAFLGSASLAGRVGQVAEKCAEFRILRENRFVEHGFETSGIDVEVAQRVPETVGMAADVAVGESETFSAMQSAGGNAFQYGCPVGFFHVVVVVCGCVCCVSAVGRFGGFVRRRTRRERNSRHMRPMTGIDCGGSGHFGSENGSAEADGLISVSVPFVCRLFRRQGGIPPTLRIRVSGRGGSPARAACCFPERFSGRRIPSLS